MTMPRTRKIGGWLAVAVATVGASEGLRLYTYPDVIGVPTYCYGETKDAKWGGAYTRKQCDERLAARLIEFNDGINDCLERGIPDSRRVAYVSLAYNIGTTAFCNSTLVKMENSGNSIGACNQILRWNRAKGVVYPGLTARREREHELCLSGEAKP